MKTKTTLAPLAVCALLGLAAVAFAGISPLTTGTYTGKYDSTCLEFEFEVEDVGLTLIWGGHEYTWNALNNQYERTENPPGEVSFDGTNQAGTFDHNMGGTGTYVRKP